MKIAVSSYSFQRLIDTGVYTQLSCVAKAKEMGFDAIEFTNLMPPDTVEIEDYAAQIRKECERQDIVISNYTIYADFLAVGVESEINRVCKQVDIACALGCTSMRHDASGGYGEKVGTSSFDDALDLLAHGCRSVAEYAAGKGVRTMVENHGFFCQDSVRVEKLIRRVDHPNFGWLVDIGNFLCVDENPVDALKRALPYAFYAHAKDFYVRDFAGPDPGRGFELKSRSGNHLRGAVVGHGDVPVARCLKMLSDSGYDGFIGLEYEGIEDVLWGIDVGLENIKKYLSM